MLHINVKELEAAVNTVMSLARKKETVQLNVDNTTAFWYLTKGGGRKTHLNKIIRPFFQWCIENRVTLKVNWVATKDMLADNISRWSKDPGDYALNPKIFQFIQAQFKEHVTLETDMFASPGNHKLRQYVARWPHWGAVAVDALTCPLESLGRGLYANPPGK